MGVLHEKALLYYKNYLYTGGMPESVKDMLQIKNDYIKYDKQIIPNIIEAYFNDMLNIGINDILNDNLSLYKSIIAENFVANELACVNVPYFYWKSKDDAEIDFLIETSNDGVIPIEVKASENTQSKSLKVYNKLYKPNYMIRISSKDFGYNPDTKIKSIPLYATFLIKELIK